MYCPYQPASAGKAKAGIVHSVSGWTRGVQVKLWDPLRTRAIPERLRGVFTTRRYTNSRLPYLTTIHSFIMPPGQHIMNTHIRKETHIRNVHNKSMDTSSNLLATTALAFNCFDSGGRISFSHFRNPVNISVQSPTVRLLKNHWLTP